MKIYLDNAATTQVDKRVLKAMLPHFNKFYGNPSSLHDFGKKASESLENSRKIIADSINAEPEEIIFTSGGTEANNMVVKELAFLMRTKGKNHIITSKIEHPSIIQPLKLLERMDFSVTYLDVNNEGFINLDQLKSSITEKTILVTIIHGNNEIGTIQDIETIGKICHEKNVPFHIDACQSYMKTEINVKKHNLDFVTLNAHKIHGPKGVGALFIKKGIKIPALIDGGGQEQGIRNGTENIPGIVGFAEAVKIYKKEDNKTMQELRDYLISKLSEISKSKLNGPKQKRLCNNINFSFFGIDGEAILLMLNEKGIAVSTGSACSQKNLKSSPILKAIGLDELSAHGSIRITISRNTTKKEIDYAITELKKTIEKLRKISMFN